MQKIRYFWWRCTYLVCVKYLTFWTLSSFVSSSPSPSSYFQFSFQSSFSSSSWALIFNCVKQAGFGQDAASTVCSHCPTPSPADISRIPTLSVQLSILNGKFQVPKYKLWTSNGYSSLAQCSLWTTADIFQNFWVYIVHCTVYNAQCKSYQNI